MLTGKCLKPQSHDAIAQLRVGDFQFDGHGEAVTAVAGIAEVGGATGGDKTHVAQTGQHMGLAFGVAAPGDDADHPASVRVHGVCRS